MWQIRERKRAGWAFCLWRLFSDQCSARTALLWASLCWSSGTIHSHVQWVTNRPKEAKPALKPVRENMSACVFILWSQLDPQNQWTMCPKMTPPLIKITLPFIKISIQKINNWGFIYTPKKYLGLNVRFLFLNCINVQSCRLHIFNKNIMHLCQLYINETSTISLLKKHLVSAE